MKSLKQDTAEFCLEYLFKMTVVLWVSIAIFGGFL